jgi:hypothetical protein
VERRPDGENKSLTRRDLTLFALGGTVLIAALKFLKVL